MKKTIPFVCIFDSSEPSIGILVLTKILDIPKSKNNKNDHTRMAFSPKKARNFKRLLLIKRLKTSNCYISFSLIELYFLKSKYISFTIIKITINNEKIRGVYVLTPEA